MWVRANLLLGQPKAVIGDLLSLVLWENPGAAFGMFPGATIFFIITGGLSVVAAIVLHSRIPDKSPIIPVTLGLIAGGALGNLIDRVRFNGNVTDFISLKFFPPVFNLADSFIVIGAITLGIYLLFFLKEEVNGGR